MHNTSRLPPVAKRPRRESGRGRARVARRRIGPADKRELG